MYAENALFFPPHLIAGLRKQRGPEWGALVERIAALPETHEEVLAFVLLMIRLNGCVPCETDSYRAMRGCGLCAAQTLRRYKGTDADLIAQFCTTLDEIRRYAHSHPHLPIQQTDVPAPSSGTATDRPVLPTAV